MVSSVSGGVAVVVALVSSVIITTIYLQRKRFGSLASKTSEACEDPQNMSNSDDSEYATIGDIMERDEPRQGLPIDRVDGASDSCHDGNMGIKVMQISHTMDDNGYIDILDKTSSLERKGAFHKHELKKRNKDLVNARHTVARSTYGGQDLELSGKPSFTEFFDEGEEEEDVVYQLDQGRLPNSYYLYPCQEETTCKPCVLHDFAECFGQQAVAALDVSPGGTLSVKDLTYAYEKMIQCTDNEYLDLSQDQDGGYEKPVDNQGGAYLDLCGEEGRSIQPSSA
ncbi:uncharacterized protein [Haliotis asinina]|uniref:uncharacterized protein n=1 Tax=Haliotis asinina TaxID=109174 RepID=UPI0035319E23